MKKLTDQEASRFVRSMFDYNPETGMFKRVGGSIWTKRFLGTWSNGSLDKSTGYYRISMMGVSFWAHRLAWMWFYGSPPSGQIDHIDGTRDNNRILNLRDVSPQVNRQNLRRPRSHNKSGVLGVHFTKSGKYEARLNLDGKTHHLGLFGNSDDAHQAYLMAKREMHLGCEI